MTTPSRALPASWVSAAVEAGVPAAWVDGALLFDAVTSTNDVALALASNGAPEGATAIAGEQTAGRGRRGRAWSSPPGAGLYFSVVFRPFPGEEAPDSQSTLLTLMAGVAVAEGVEWASGLRAEIKWPNDLVVARRAAPGAPGTWRKLAGILAEGAFSGADLQHVVVGVGINVGRAAHPAVDAPVTSIEEAIGQPVSLARLWACCAGCLARRREEVQAGGPAPVLAAWRARSPSSVGARVAWQADVGRLEGVTAGIDASGALLVDRDGERVRVVAGALSWKGPGDGC